jgi:hypothetical protein
MATSGIYVNKFDANNQVSELNLYTADIFRTANFSYSGITVNGEPPNASSSMYIPNAITFTLDFSSGGVIRFGNLYRPNQFYSSYCSLWHETHSSTANKTISMGVYIYFGSSFTAAVGAVLMGRVCMGDAGSSKVLSFSRNNRTLNWRNS